MIHFGGSVDEFCAGITDQIDRYYTQLERGKLGYKLLYLANPSTLLEGRVTGQLCFWNSVNTVFDVLMNKRFHLSMQYAARTTSISERTLRRWAKAGYLRTDESKRTRLLDNYAMSKAMFMSMLLTELPSVSRDPHLASGLAGMALNHWNAISSSERDVLIRIVGGSIDQTASIIKAIVPSLCSREGRYIRKSWMG